MSSIILSNTPSTMSSREIAELTGKRHDHVMRDIESQLTELLDAEGVPKFGETSNKKGLLNFEDTYRNDQNGQEYRQYRLPKRECLIVVSGYSVELRARIIDRWIELESQAALPPPATKPKASIREERELQALARDTMRTLKVFGITGNAAVLSTDNYCRTIAGRSLLEPLGATHLLADQRGMTYTPTELGKMCDPPLSAIKLNLALESAGLQKRDMGQWMPSDKAATLCEWLDTGKRHGDGTPVKQLKWFKAVLEQIAQGGLKEAA
jgi:phage regulator Rha-like protein